jgi:hypothetical protein
MLAYNINRDNFFNMLSTIVCFLVPTFYTLVNSEIVTQWYRMQGFDDSGSVTSYQEVHTDSLITCSASCTGPCWCYGFNSKEKKCRLHQKCNTVDFTAYGDGWRFYTKYNSTFHVYFLLISADL